MEDVKIIISALWVSTMFIYLLGDVLRIFSGDSEKMFAAQAQVTQVMWVVIAIIMVIPAVMVFLSLTLQYPVNRWANIIVALFFFLFSLVQVNTYPGAYDKFLLIVSMGFNVLIVWYAWKWV